MHALRVDDLAVRRQLGHARADRNDASTSAVAKHTVSVRLRRSASGDTGSAIAIGKSTALGPNEQPLFIVDGVRASQEALNRFTPDQILSIEVIKGPAAAKVYGPDGAKGVIVITTKSKK